MSYRRTVMCRVCYKTGHNQRTCPKLREQAAANPDSYAAQRVAHHNKTGRNKVCSYCQQPSHNKATCQKLLNDRVGAVIANKQFRKDTIERFKELGIGLGTLFQLKTSYGDSQLLMVDEIRWDEIVYQSSYNSIIVNNHGEPDPYHCFTVDQHFYDMLKTGTLVIEVPASEDNIGVGIPKDWDNGMSNIARAFPAWD